MKIRSWPCLEVDYEFLDEIHELQNDYPLPPEKLLKLPMIYCQVIKDTYCKYYKQRWC